MKPNSQFCPKCGKVVTTVLPPSPEAFQPAQAPAQPAAKEGTIWGIDKRIVLLAIVFLILVLPIFPIELGDTRGKDMYDWMEAAEKVIFWQEHDAHTPVLVGAQAVSQAPV